MLWVAEVNPFVRYHNMSKGTAICDYYSSDAVVDAYFKHVGKNENLTKGAMEAVNEFRKKKNLSSKYGHLLDVGCGNGNDTVEFLKYFPQVTAVDVSEAQIAKAREVHKGVNVEFLVAPAEKIPVEDSSIDVIVSIFALHFFKLDDFLKECNRILKRDGVIILMASPILSINGRSELSDNSRGVELTTKLMSDLDQYGREISHPQWHVFDQYHELYREIHGFKKSRDDSKTFNTNTSVKKLKDRLHWIPFFHRPKSKEIIEGVFEELKKMWGVEHLADDNVEITMKNVMNIITLSKI